jgi:hypothetical protein
LSERHHGHEHSRPPGIHKDWKTWVAGIVMLGAIGIYVPTLDDSVEVMNERAAEAPAATGSATP